MTDEVDVYEEWIAHTGDKVYVHKDDHQLFASRGGWWNTAFRASFEELSARGLSPEPRKPMPLPKPA
jgi:hypothetical protein